MPAVRKCSFCGGRVEPGAGLMLAKRDGTILFFCSSKCERNLQLGRKSMKVKWTERARRLKAKK